MAKKYSGYNENDTKWDEFHRERGQMTNREFFTSNSEGGFYEGMVWDEERQEWVLNAEEQYKEDQRDAENRCSHCGYLNSVCQQECDGYPQRDSFSEDDY